MANKITLANLANLQNENTAVATINANDALIATAIDNTLSRDGTGPNQMTSELDMNSRQIINLPSPLTANSPLRLEDLNDFVGGGTVTNIPNGGTTGQVLSKNSNSNFDVEWSDALAVDGDGNYHIPWTKQFSVGGVEADLGNFFVNRIPNTNLGRLIQMQLGKDAFPSPNYYLPGPGGGTAIELDMNFDGGLTGSPTRGTAGVTIVNNMQAGSAGSATGLFAQAVATGTWTDGGTGFGGVTGISCVGRSTRGGAVFGMNPYAWADTVPATGVCGMEVNTSNRINGTLSKAGIQIVDDPESTGTIATTDNFALAILAAVGAYGYDHAIRIGHPSGLFPIRVNGAILSTSTGTVSTGFDFSNLTFTSGRVLITKNNSHFSSYNAAGLAIKQLVGLNTSDKLSLYDGIGLLSATGNLQLGASGTLGNITLGNATSGTVTVQPVTGALGTVTLSLPAATDTLVGKATTDTFTNKTFDTAGTGNSFSINSVAVTANTGTGAVVRATSPTLVTPTIGVATATTINGVTINASTGTLSLTSGKTFTVNNTLSLAGTDSTTITFQGTDTYVGRATTDTFTNKTFNTAGTGNIFQINGTTISANTGTGSNVLATSPTLVTPVLGVATATSINGVTINSSTGVLSLTSGKTLTFNNTLTFAGTDSTTLTFQGTDTYVGRATTDTLTNKTFNTSGTGNVFQIAGTGITAVTGTGSVVLATAPTFVTSATVGTGAGTEFLRISGGASSGQGPALKLLRGAVEHNFGFSSAVLGGTSDDFIIYGSGANNLRFYANGVLGLTLDTTAKIVTRASTTSGAPFNMIHGSAPTSPVDGDVWREDNTNTGLKIRINGVTKTITVS